MDRFRVEMETPTFQRSVRMWPPKTPVPKRKRRTMGGASEGSSRSGDQDNMCLPHDHQKLDVRIYASALDVSTFSSVHDEMILL